MPLVSASPSLLACCAYGLCFAVSTQAASDSGPIAMQPPTAEVAARAEAELVETAFARGLTALKAKRLEEARLLFQYAARNTDIKTYPLGWLTAQFNACHSLCLQGKNEEAEALARQLTTTCEAELGLEDPLTSEALAYLAFVLKHVGHQQDAEPVYRRTVQVLEAKYGQEHPQVAMAMTKHGDLLDMLGRHPEAEVIHRRALAIMEKIGRGDSSCLCIYLTNLAHCLQARHKTREAEQLMERAFGIAQTTADANLQVAGMILRKQTEFYRDRGQFERAENLGHRALLRLAQRSDINRARFFYYDMVADLYRSVLKARGMNEDDIIGRIHKVEDEANSLKSTASVP